MRADTGVYPSLGRYFKTKAELADAACIKRNHLHLCLKGERQFTKQQQTAIANAIIVKIITGEIDEDLTEIVEARTDFDKVFKERVNK